MGSNITQFTICGYSQKFVNNSCEPNPNLILLDAFNLVYANCNSQLQNSGLQSKLIAICQLGQHSFAFNIIECIMISISSVIIVLLIGTGCCCFISQKKHNRASLYEDKKTLTKQSFKTWSENQDDTSKTKDVSCSICLENFSESSVIRATACKHCFHADCLDKWTRLKQRPDCPNCKQFI